MQNLNHDEWRVKLIEMLIECLNGNELVYEEIGYYYLCYAPASIYKYYSNDERNLKAVKENKMWYSALNKFNDPFDGDFLIDREKIFQCAIQNLPNKREIRAGSPAWKNVRALMKQQVKDLRKTFEQIRHTTGVTCFSEKDDSLLMWAHYANNHKGMCVEYELMKFNTQLMYSPVPIIYSPNRINLEYTNIYDGNNVEKETMAYFVNCLIHKSMEWEYETEWRIIRDEGACGCLWDLQKQGALLDSVQPSSIILGCEAEDEFINEVKQYCIENKINLFKMCKDEIQYKLNKITILHFDIEEDS